MRVEERLQLRPRRLSRCVLILRQKLHLLNQPASDDFIVFIKVQRERLPVEHFVLEVTLH